MKSLSVGILFLLPLLLIGQGEGLRLYTSVSPAKLIYTSNPVTYELPELKLLIQAELKKKGYLNLDLIISWSSNAISICKSNYCPEALPGIYTDLGRAYMHKTHIQEARKLFLIASGFAQANNDLVAEAEARIGLGFSFIYGNHYQAAVSNGLYALSLAHLMNNDSLKVDIYDKLTRIYYLSRDFLNAYQSAKHLQEVAHKIHDQEALLRSFSLLSDLFGEMGLFDKQDAMVDSCLARTLFVRDSASLYSILNMAYEASLNVSDYHGALKYATRMQALTGELYNAHLVDAKIGKAYLKLNQLEDAKIYYERSLTANAKNSIYIDTYKYLDLGNIEFGLGNKKEALRYYKLAEADIGKPLLPIQRDICKALYAFYDDAGDIHNALGYLEKYNYLADSLHRFQNAMRYGVVLLEQEALLGKGQMEMLSKDNALNAAMALRQKQKKNMAYASTIAILLITGSAFYRYKKYRELKHKTAITSERLRISRDLHDEVGSALSGIAMYSHVANEQIKEGRYKDVNHSLKIMHQSATQMIEKLSDIVWLINPEQDTIAELFDRLEEFTHQVTNIRNMTVAVHIPEKFEEIHLPLEARRSIYLFCKEAINNAVKYSEGTKIWLEVKEDDAGLRFTVRDNGKGFDEMTIKKGNGLRNMQKRAEEIGAMVNFKNDHGIGTQIDMYYKIMQ